MLKGHVRVQHSRRMQRVLSSYAFAGLWPRPSGAGCPHGIAPNEPLRPHGSSGAVNYLKDAERLGALSSSSSSSSSSSNYRAAVNDE